MHRPFHTILRVQATTPTHQSGRRWNGCGAGILGLLLLLSSLPACSGDADGHAADAGSVDTTADPCMGLDEAACTAAKICSPQLGFATNGCEKPPSAPTFAGCLRSVDANGEGIVCTGALTCANQGKKFMVFPSGCLPSDWLKVTTDVENCCPQETQLSWFACNKASDCGLFETQCCDHCNGGKLQAVNLQYMEQANIAQEIYKLPQQCRDVACTEMSCSPGVAACVAGVCVVK